MKKCSSSSIDLFKRSKSNHSNFVFVNDDTTNVKFFKLSRIINKRMIKKRNVEYLVEWKDYESKHDIWRNLSKLDNAMNLVDEYEAIMIQSILFDRLISFSSSIKSIKSIKTIKSTIKKNILRKSFELFNLSIRKSIIFIILIRKSFTNSSIKILFEQKFVVVISLKTFIVDVFSNTLIRQF